VSGRRPRRALLHRPGMRLRLHPDPGEPRPGQPPPGDLRRLRRGADTREACAGVGGGGMSERPDRPFLPAAFETEGGGIDFLGMRQVNLSLLQEELIPGLNNTTADLGTFCLGAWIPWKFRRLCRDEKDFVLSKYTAFHQAVQVAMAYATRD